MDGSLWSRLEGRWQRWRKQRPWTLFCLCLVSFMVLFIALSLLYLFKGVRSPDWSLRPKQQGFRGDNFEVRVSAGVAQLWINNTPYPTPWETTNRPVQTLNGRWQMRLDKDDRGVSRKWFLKDDKDSWFETQVPGTYNSYNSSFRDHTGVTWFRRRFQLALSNKNRVHRLRFGAVLMRAKVWLNGQYLGRHEGGYSPFFFDLKKPLAVGQTHSLVVRVDNRLNVHSVPPQTRVNHEAGWAEYGGITRDVRLESLPLRSISKCALKPFQEEGEAGFKVEVVAYAPKDKQAYSLQLELLDPLGKSLAVKSFKGLGAEVSEGFQQKFVLARLLPWSPKSPLLYTLRVHVIHLAGSDRCEFKTGWRQVRCQGSQLLLNDKALFLQGIAKHEDHPDWGASNPPALLKEDLQKIQSMGANYVRVSHYPHSLAELRSIRDRGLLAAEEIPLYQAGMGWVAWLWKSQKLGEFPGEQFGSRQAMDARLLDNAQLQIIEMIERDINNPAVILWSVGNENFSLTSEAVDTHRWLRDVVKTWDPTRLVTYSEFTFGVGPLDSMRGISGEMDVISLNMYHGWYFGSPEDAGPYLDKVHAKWPDKPIIISECGAGAAPGRSDKDGVFETGKMPYGRSYSEDYQAKVLASIWQQVQARPYMVGFSPWVYADFYCPWFPQNPVPGFNLKGVHSRERKPKKGFYTLQEAYLKNADRAWLKRNQ